MVRSSVFLIVFLFLALPFSSFAAVITKVKGKSVLIELKGDPAAAGDSFYAVGSNGKRSAIISIAKVKGDKAIGRIAKGKATTGMNLEKRSAKGSTASRTSGRSRTSSSPSGRAYWGGLLGYSMDSMDVNVNDSTTGEFREKASLSGSGFSVKGLFDYELFSQIWFRGSSGLEMFNVSGKAACGALNAEACDAKITYLSLDFMARYVFSNGNYRPWAGAGVSLLFPMSKSATALQAQSISTTNVLAVAGGLDWFISPNLYIPLSIEYGMLPKSDEVEATWIALRAGFAVPF